jgi:hypothetical protein
VRHRSNITRQRTPGSSLAIASSGVGFHSARS